MQREARAFIPRAMRRLAALWPREQRCAGCLSAYKPGVGKGADIFCPACLAALPRRERGHCPACGEPAAWPGLPVALCARCLEKKPLWEEFVFHGLYEGQLKKMLLALKFHENVALAHALGGLLAAHPGLAALKADALVPVPLHVTRLARRGYNQALELARPLARTLSLPLRPELLLRTRATAPQSGHSREQRRDNIRGAFACPRTARGMRLLLVDDTLTTGSTLEVACETLLRAGAARVGVAVISRTPLRYATQRHTRANYF